MYRLVSLSGSGLKSRFLGILNSFCFAQKKFMPQWDALLDYLAIQAFFETKRAYV